MYIYIWNDWIKVINYFDDTLYYTNNENVRQLFELILKNKFNLSLLRQSKWHLCIRIIQRGDFTSLGQDQYAKNIVCMYKKAFNYPLKIKDFPPPISFVPTEKDSPTIDE